MTARQVAEQLGVSSETILRWTRSGALPGFRLPRGALRYRDTDVEEWLEGRGTIEATKLNASETRGRSVNLAGTRPPKRRGGDQHASDPARAAYKLSSGKWGLRYYDGAGKRRRKTAFATESSALKHYREVIEPRLRGEPEQLPEMTLAEFVELYLERHAATVRPRTIATLRDRLRHSLACIR